MLTRRTTLAGSAALALAVRPRRARAASTLKIGLINDESGPYMADGGPGSVACARQAIAEFAGQANLPVELLVADHQNKADVGIAIVRQWFDQGVDVVMDIQNSGIAIALTGLVHEKDKALLVCNSGITDLTGKMCQPTTVHFSYDNYMLARAIGGALVKTGGDTWYFIIADYAFGHSMESEAARFVTQAGGKILGNSTLPFPNADFSSALLSAKASGAKVIGLANSGTDMADCIKQAAEFGITQSGVKVATLLMQISRVDGLGLEAAQGCVTAAVFYWDMNDHTRGFANRVQAAMPQKSRPNQSQASCYSAVLHYLKAAKELGVDETKRSGAGAVAKMKAIPIKDDVYGDATIREDGRVIAPAYLFRVKSPKESRYPWDYYDLMATIPPDQAWRPLAEGGCPFVKG